MKKIRTLTFGTLLVFCIFCFTGCGDYTGKEKSHPLFVKAEASTVAGNYKEAAQYFEEFLYVCPRSALTHYKLAALYGDNLDDPFRAVYHYGKYLELSPASADSEDVQKFSEACRKRLFEKLSKEYETVETGKAYAEVTRLRLHLQKYVEYAGKLRAQNEQMRKIIQDRKFVREVTVQPLRTSNQPQTPPQRPAQTPAQAAAGNDPFAQGTVDVRTTPPGTQQGAKPAVQPAAKPAAQPAAQPVAAPRIYVVQKGDTLSKISKTMYGTSKYYPNIMKANKDVIGPKGIVYPGMKLKIPVIEGR